ncbi:hypothetical protein AG1IA_01230 [Rhizoctonia solani AG-1 IA]|uniref:Uncharacterized protein n=1 Tax=Thanatephorus cucumeris (strain AG1-IA) TaxID=983506 RepID=L8X7W8_THACA|nr:hypothetical protein AG1IA_01230 [Rhizoctonia solani AG-1 IA]
MRSDANHGEGTARVPTEALIIYPGGVARAYHDKYLLDLRRHVAPFRKIRSRPHPGSSAPTSLHLRLWGRQTHRPQHHTIRTPDNSKPQDVCQLRQPPLSLAYMAWAPSSIFLIKGSFFSRFSLSMSSFVRVVWW